MKFYIIYQRNVLNFCISIFIITNVSATNRIFSCIFPLSLSLSLSLTVKEIRRQKYEIVHSFHSCINKYIQTMLPRVRNNIGKRFQRRLCEGCVGILYFDLKFLIVFLICVTHVEEDISPSSWL